MANSRPPQNQRLLLSCAQESVYPTIKIEDDGSTTMEYPGAHFPQTSHVLQPSHSQSYTSSHSSLASLARLTPLNSETLTQINSSVQIAADKIPRKQDRWTKFEEDTLNQLFNSRKKDLRFKPHFAPAWVQLVEDLQQACRDQNISCDKNARQCKNKLNYMTKKSKRGNGGAWRNTSNSTRVSQEDEGSDNETEEISFDENGLNSPLNEQESAEDSRNTPQSIDDNNYVQPSPVQLLPPVITPTSTRTDELNQQSNAGVKDDKRLQPSNTEHFKAKTTHEATQDGGNVIPCPECHCKRRSSTSSEIPAKVLKIDEHERMGGDKRQMIDFLEKAQQKYEDILLKYAEIEKQRTEMHLKFTLDAMSMMAQTLKDIVNNQN